MMKRMIPMLLIVLAACSLVISAMAAEIPDLERPGSITFLMDWEGEPLNSGSLSLYQVGQAAEMEGVYTFTLIEALADSGVSLEDLHDAALPGTLAALAEERSLTPVTAPITDGQAVFTDVMPGLYLVTQPEACEGFAPINAFLISLPQYEQEAYIYDLTAYPKVPLETVPTEPTESTEPTEPTQPTSPTDPTDLPQTGQNNWPVPVMALSGLALAALGVILCAGKRKA